MPDPTPPPSLVERLEIVLELAERTKLWCDEQPYKHTMRCEVKAWAMLCSDLAAVCRDLAAQQMVLMAHCRELTAKVERLEAPAKYICTTRDSR